MTRRGAELAARPRPVLPLLNGWLRTLWLGPLAVGLALPFYAEGFVTYQFTMAGIYAIAIIGLNLLTGYNGQFSLGHSAFFAIGAYAMAILLMQIGMPVYLTIPLAGVAGFVAGFLFGWPALRLDRVYLALATYGLAVALPQALKSRHVEQWTGGVQGLYLDRPEPPAWLPLNDDQWWYFVTAVCLAVAVWTARNLVRGRVGRAITAIREHPIAARAMGINLPLYKTLTFGVSGAYTAVAGALAALMADFIAPDSYTLGFSFLLLIGVVVGGVRSIGGALIGGLFIQFLPLLAGAASKSLSFPALGLVLIVVVLLMPNGAAGLWRDLAARLQLRRH